MRLTSSNLRRALQKALPGETIEDTVRRLSIPVGWPVGEAAPPPRPTKVEKQPQNLKDFQGFWTKSIWEVDRHSLRCKSCNKPRNSHRIAVEVDSLLDPALERYRPCRKAKELYRLEVEARKAYLGAGGQLPTA
jgi:hypothetical protein